MGLLDCASTVLGARGGAEPLADVMPALLELVVWWGRTDRASQTLPPHCDEVESMWGLEGAHPPEGSG